MFWEFKNIDPTSAALIDDSPDKILTYGKLKDQSDSVAELIKDDEKKLVFLFCDNSIESVVTYFAVLRSGNAVFLANSRMDNKLKGILISIYKPEIIFSIEEISDLPLDYNHQILDNKFYFYTIKKKQPAIRRAPLNKDLAVLLSTSGTTGSPKLVKLSYKNIQSNAESIAEYLEITENEKPVTSLPMSYSFGLSVINSHILKGASIVCTNKSMVMRDFWNTFNENGCTSFSGVPYNYQMLQRLKFEKLELPTLKTMTQAGGRLSEEFIKYFYDAASAKGIKFFVMYGQTEATARISYVPFEKLGDKIGSIGIPIPNGEIKIFSDNEEAARQIGGQRTEGELVYFGQNVMMGYAEKREDLSKDDELNGELHTGDLAYKDEDGFCYITGRLKRFIKLFGLRVNLDEIEKMVENEFALPAACYGTDDSLKILLQTTDNNFSDSVKKKVIDIYKLHHSVVFVKCAGSIPVTPSGKKDYKLIQETVAV
ncbi:MAG: AMP-binding protein [Ignavibacteriaceae bacterium]